jgi:RND family efflux transporter MFP subunit
MKESSIKVSRLAGIFVALAALGVAILWFSGAFETGKVAPGEEERPPGLPSPEEQGQAVREERPAHYVAVGTIRSRTEATVAAQVSGRVTGAKVDAGETVDQGDLLATLDSQEMASRVGQARSGLDSAKAELADAELHYGRIKRLLPERAATQVQMDAAEARLKQARAAVAAARKKLEEARIVLQYTQVRAPMTGVVAKREVDAGDLAYPGRPLFVIHNPKGLRLEASVREGMIGRVKRGQKVDVELTALSEMVEGTVEEIVPSADPLSRSFLVKVALPVTEGLYPGMFGRLRIRLEERSTVLVPEAAVSQVGQLKTVRVLKDGRWVRRYVTLGERAGGRIEVLSGLEGGETIGWDPTGPSGEAGEEGSDERP